MIAAKIHAIPKTSMPTIKEGSMAPRLKAGLTTATVEGRGAALHRIVKKNSKPFGVTALTRNGTWVSLGCVGLKVIVTLWFG